MREPSTDRTAISNDTVQKAQGLYLTLTGLTSSPHEAAQMILIMHILLWLNCKSGEQAVDTMLTEYVENFKSNLRENGQVGDLQQ